VTDPPASPSLRILLVASNVDLRTATEELLVGLGHRVTTASAERADPGTVDVAVVEAYRAGTPGAAGLALADRVTLATRRFRAAGGRLPTGAPLRAGEWAELAVEDSGSGIAPELRGRLLAKPFMVEQLAARIELACERRGPVQPDRLGAADRGGEAP
jgi:CheY-like chemotaxis protein